MSLSDLLDLGGSGDGGSSGSSGLSSLLGKSASKLSSSSGGGSGGLGLGLGSSSDWGFSSTPKPPSHPTHITFYGPSAKSILSSRNAEMSTLNPSTNQKTPVFACKFSSSKPNISISRIHPNGASDNTPLMTANASTLSGNCTFSVRGSPEIKLKTDWMSDSGAKTFDVPNLGHFAWKMSSDGMGYNLVDANKTKLAHFATMSDNLSGDPRLDILVPGDDFFVELVVISAVAMLKSDEKQIKILMRVLGQV